MSDGGIVYENTIHESLGIRTVETGPERVVLEMDVSPRVHQPFGLLHGGASAVLAESAASIGAYLASADDELSVGTDLNISHLRAKRDGVVRAVAVPLRKGRSIHVWTVDIVDEDGSLVAAARCTLAIRRARGSGGKG
ncbi:MAG TPA: PaaI family thioesterase [Actinomycetota bacterium]|nr:PaaI family thioesterase [Actinomycetota bacterium]